MPSRSVFLAHGDAQYLFYRTPIMAWATVSQRRAIMLFGFGAFVAACVSTAVNSGLTAFGVAMLTFSVALGTAWWSEKSRSEGGRRLAWVLTVAGVGVAIYDVWPI